MKQGEPDEWFATGFVRVWPPVWPDAHVVMSITARRNHIVVGNRERARTVSFRHRCAKHSLHRRPLNVLLSMLLDLNQFGNIQQEKLGSVLGDAGRVCEK